MSLKVFGQIRTDWVREFKNREAYWLHDGNPLRPHALLTEGKHSDGFFNSELIMEDPLCLEKAVADLLKTFSREWYRDLETNTFDKVVGPAMGAITLAHELARQISIDLDAPCLRAYAERESKTSKNMVFKRTKILPGENVLICEDVISTGSSVQKVASAVRSAGGRIAPYLLVLVNRSGLKKIGGMEVISLIDQPMAMWEPDECPLCRINSKAIRPKANENWELLNKEY